MMQQIDAAQQPALFQAWLTSQTQPTRFGSEGGSGEAQLTQTVTQILKEVQAHGDTALIKLSEQFNDNPPALYHAEDEFLQRMLTDLDPNLKKVLDKAAENIRRYGEAIVSRVEEPMALQQEGYEVGCRWQPVQRVGCYVPAGRYPLPSSALMTAITAQVAGVPERILVSPQLLPATIYAGQLAGVSAFAQLGGAQAVAALAFGTGTFPKVDMFVGPGNRFVTEAKRQLQGVIGIDMLAGPSEVVVIADDAANPTHVALDLLSQAEHGPDSLAHLLTPSTQFANAVLNAVQAETARLNLPPFVEDALNNSALVVLPDLMTCAAVSNQLAPEHLHIQVTDVDSLQALLTDYGALFVGKNATVAFGDYMAGPNHTLPTSQAARFSGMLNPLTFLRPQSWLKPTGNILNLAETTAIFARAEGLTAHAEAALARQ